MAEKYGYRIRGDKWNYQPGKKKHRISRTKIDLFTECPRCFYLDQRLGIARPSMPGFTLNIAVDALLKKEFDIHRAKESAHPLMEEYGIDAIPYAHAELDTWRENFTGVSCHHTPTDFEVFGAVDDIWVNPQGELIVVDYKATSKGEEPTLEGRWGDQYKRQMEVYQWLLRQNNFTVSNTGYFVYANGKKDREAFDRQLEFDINVIAHTGDDSWIEDRLVAIKETLDSEEIPAVGKLCDYCPYRKAAGEALLKMHHANKKK